MKIPAVVIASSVYRDWLRTRVGELLELTALSAEEAMQQPGVFDATELVLVELPATDPSGPARLIERVGERYPQLPIIALGDAQQPDAMLVAMRAGARDFLASGRDDATASTQIERVLRRGVSRGQGHGQLLAVLGGHPNNGLAFLATHLALAAHETRTRSRSESVLLLDVAMPAGSAPVFLNMHQEYGALNAIQDAYRCDQTLVDTAFGRHGSGLYVLGLPELQIGVPAVDADDLASLLDVLRGLFSVTVIAVDATLGLRALQATVERANHSLLLSDQSILNSRFNQNLLHSLRQAGCTLDHLGLVVERYHRKLGLEPEKLASLLQLPLMATLGGDGLNRIQAMNAGEPMFSFAPRDEYPQAVRQLLQQLLAGRARAEGETRRGVLGRLLG